MQSISSWITTNAGPAFMFFAFAGALAHWVSKAVNKDVSWDPLEYWLRDHPGRSGAALVLLVGAIWAVVSGDNLVGMRASMIVSMAFGMGWAIDSGANKGVQTIQIRTAPPSAAPEPPRKVKVPPLMGRKTRRRSTKAKGVTK